MGGWFKKWLKRYDDWCESMGLTPENKRSCVPYKADPVSAKDDPKEKPSDEQ